MDDLLFEARDGVAWLTLNRPRKANALTLEMHERLVSLLEELTRNSNIVAAVLTGAGERAFSGGADMSPLPENRPEYLARRRTQLPRTLRAALDFPKPIVAAVNGAACGAGMMLALVCDLVVAARSARFALPEINIGRPTLPGIAVAKHFMGEAVTADLVLTGRFMDAEESWQRGLVAKVVPDDRLRDHAHELARSLGGKDHAAYRANKQWLRRDLRAALDRAAEASARESY